MIMKFSRLFFSYDFWILTEITLCGAVLIEALVDCGLAIGQCHCWCIVSIQYLDNTLAIATVVFFFCRC